MSAAAGSGGAAPSSPPLPPGVLPSVVIGAGQAGLASSYHLIRRGIEHVLLDAEDSPGGAWQHRWDSLTMRDVHGVADLPGLPAPPQTSERANLAVPRCFGDYERRFALPVHRPVAVRRVVSEGEQLRVVTDRGEVRTRTLISATGTWTRPFVPHLPGIEDFRGAQLHTATYRGADALRGKRVLVVGAGASAIQLLGEIAPLAQTLWATRRPPRWAADGFDGLAAVTGVEERVTRGLPPRSVVDVTGLRLRAQEEAAHRLGAYDDPLPMPARLTADGATWEDGRQEHLDVILWATGFRPALSHLAPLGLRSPEGGIALVRVPGNVQGATTTVRDPRVNLVGYGPSASTIGAGRAARQAALAVQRLLAGTG